MAGKPDTSKQAQKKSALKIHATQDSRWRAGMKFGRDPQTILVSKLSKEKIKLLQADPLLVVESIEV